MWADSSSKLAEIKYPFLGNLVISVEESIIIYFLFKMKSPENTFSPKAILYGLKSAFSVGILAPAIKGVHYSKVLLLKNEF